VSTGLSPQDAQAAARQALGDAWTPSVAASLSRYLRLHRQPRPGAGGDHRSPVAIAVAEQLHQAATALKDLRQKMAEELTAAQRRAERVWSLSGTSADAAQDARRLLRRPGLRPSARRLYDFAALEAPVVAAQEDWAGIRAYWENEMAVVRQTAWAAIQPLIAKASEREAEKLRGRAERILGPVPGTHESVPIITAWHGDRLSAHATAIDLWADDVEEDLWASLPGESDGLGGKRQGHYAARRTMASLQVRQVWQSF